MHSLYTVSSYSLINHAYVIDYTAVIPNKLVFTSTKDQ